MVALRNIYLNFPACQRKEEATAGRQRIEMSRYRVGVCERHAFFKGGGGLDLPADRC